MPVDHLIEPYIASEETYPDKAVIIEEGNKGNWVYVVLKGKVKVTQRTAKGTVTIETLKEGDIFGEMALFEIGEESRTASVIADGPVEVGLLDNELLIHEFESLSSQLKDLISSLILRLRDTTKKASALAIEAK